MHNDSQDRYAQLLESVVTDIREVQNPDELKQLRRVVRRTVPMSLRPYLGAYLLKLLAAGSLRSSAKGPRTPEKHRDATAAARPKAPAQREGFRRLFVNAGRVQKVRPEDLKELFLSRLELQEGELGEVTVLGKYSFVEVADSRAGDAVSQLSGSTLKGRKLAVDYARPPR